MRLRAQVEGLPLVIVPLVLLLATFWPVGPVLPSQDTGGSGLGFVIKGASGHLRNTGEVYTMGQRRLWAHVGFSPA